MHCKYCGTALSKNSPICPKCKRIMTKEQLDIRKEINGVNNPYMERLEKIKYDMFKNNIEKNEQHISVKPYIIILTIILVIVLLMWFIG